MGSASNAMVAGQRQKPKFSVAITTEGYQKLIRNTLGDPERSKRFVAAITSAVAVNKQLQECDAGSVLAGALLGESLNLSPSPQLRQYYLVPFEDKKAQEKRAVFVLGYVGYIQLAIRSGYYKDIDAMEIRQGEYLGRDPETGKTRFKFIEDDDAREALPVIGYMAYFEYMNGFKKVIYWSRDKMLRHADKYSAAFSLSATGGKYPKVSFEDYSAGKYNKKDEWLYSSYWYKDFDGMAKKTLIRQLLSKWGMLSIDMQRAVVSDNTFVEVDNGDFITTEADTTQDEPIETAVSDVDLSGEFDGVGGQVNLDEL